MLFIIISLRGCRVKIKCRKVSVKLKWNKNKTRKSYYGCYCLPEGFDNIAAKGYGQPVDDIDK